MCPVALYERFQKPPLLCALEDGIDEVKAKDRFLVWIFFGGFTVVFAD